MHKNSNWPTWRYFTAKTHTLSCFISPYGLNMNNPSLIKTFFSASEFWPTKNIVPPSVWRHHMRFSEAAVEVWMLFNGINPRPQLRLLSGIEDGLLHIKNTSRSDIWKISVVLYCIVFVADCPSLLAEPLNVLCYEIINKRIKEEFVLRKGRRKIMNSKPTTVVPDTREGLFLGDPWILRASKASKFLFVTFFGSKAIYDSFRSNV